MAFGSFIGRYGGFFRTRTRDNAAVAERYLQGLAQAEEATFAAMATVVEQGCEQQFQHFISNSPWRHEPVVEQIGRDADRLLGGKPTSALIIDESSFVKQGDHSVGVARQWCGRLGKVDNCQVAVFAVLTDGAAARAGRHAALSAAALDRRPGALRPGRDPGSPCGSCARRADLALEIVRAARARGMRFAWVGVDGGYGKEPAFLRALDDAGEVFVADVHSTQMVWTEPPGLHVPAAEEPTGAPADQATGRRQNPSRWSSWSAGSAPRTGPAASCATAPVVPCRSTSRTGGSGLWDGEEAKARCWHLIVRREVGSPRTVKYSLSNAPADTTPLQLARRCRDSATGSSAPSRTPKASVVSPTIRCWAGSPGTTTSPW